MRIQMAIVILSYSLGHNGVGAMIHVASRHSPAPTHSPASTALRFFQDLPGTDVAAKLRSLRRPPPQVGEGVRALADVPPESVLEPNARESWQLAALKEVLAYHERQDRLVIRVIDVPVAAIALHARAVLLISRPALGLLSSTELQATVAHEIGHDYFSEEYGTARQRGDVIGLQVVEMKCDGVAALTLVALGLDPRHLYRAIERIGRFNQVPSSRWGKNGYPHPRDRERFVDDLIRSLCGSMACSSWTCDWRESVKDSEELTVEDRRVLRSPSRFSARAKAGATLRCTGNS